MSYTNAIAAGCALGLVIIALGLMTTNTTEETNWTTTAQNFPVKIEAPEQLTQEDCDNIQITQKNKWWFDEKKPVQCIPETNTLYVPVDLRSDRTTTLTIKYKNVDTTLEISPSALIK